MFEEVNVNNHRVDFLGDATPPVAEWDELSDRVGTHLASRPSYCLSAHRLRPNRTMRVVTVRRDGRLVALAPLVTRTFGGFTRARIAGDSLGMVGEILSEDDDASDALWDAVASAHIALRLTMVDSRSRAVARLLRHPAWHSEVSDEDVAPTIAVPEAGWADLRGPRSRRRLRSAWRRMNTDVSTRLAFDTVTTSAGLDARWDDMRAVSTLGVAGTEHTDYLAAPVDSVVRTVLGAEADAGRATVTGLLLDGAWRAHLLTVRTGTSVEGWLTHYDPALEHLQPGHQIMAQFVDAAREAGVTTLDLGAGSNGFKHAWATGHYRAVTVDAVPTAMPSLQVADAVARRVQSSDTVRHARRVAGRVVRRARSSLGS